MTSQEFKSTLLIKRPRYANSRIPIIEILVNKGSRTSEYSQFGSIYELYIYALMLGLKNNLRSLLILNYELNLSFEDYGKY